MADSTHHNPVRLVYISIGFKQPTTLPKTNIAPENMPSQKESSLPTIHFQVLLLLVSGGVDSLGNYHKLHVFPGGTRPTEFTRFLQGGPKGQRKDHDKNHGGKSVLASKIGPHNASTICCICCMQSMFFSSPSHDLPFGTSLKKLPGSG